ncbi:MAG: cysteine desulfurase [Spirochaetales bacterium]|nr:cysteine desulfurase [Spirochaetales bacterium]
MKTTGYFDHAATTFPSIKALERYRSAALEYWANPSTRYPEGRKSHAYLETMRDSIAKMLDVRPNHIIFTSGATEANDIVFQSLLLRLSPGEVIISGIEHSSIIQQQRALEQTGWKVIMLKAPHGFVDPKDLAKALTPKTRLVSIMSLNNAVGTLQDIPALTGIVREYEKTTGRAIHFHTDATQQLGKLPIDLLSWDVDSASFGAHKFHGPKGVGFLYNTFQGVENLSKGGGQEAGMRGGTENLAGIASMEAALAEALANQKRVTEHVTRLNDLFRQTLKSHVTVLTQREHSSPYIITVSTALPAEVMVRMLIERGFSVSAGSACSSNARAKGQRVLEMMEVTPEHRGGAIRISFSDSNTEEETVSLARAINTVAKETV